MGNETWVKRHYQIPGRGEGYLVMEGKRLIADCPEEDDADQIIRDHEALQTAREALEDITLLKSPNDTEELRKLRYYE